MIILTGTNADLKEQLKARTGGHKLKELVGIDHFEIEEIYLLAPETEDAEDGDNRTQVALKVNGVYYKGISERIVKAAAEIIDWIMQSPPETDSKINARITKSAGRYGVFDIELL